MRKYFLYLGIILFLHSCGIKKGAVGSKVPEFDMPLKSGSIVSVKDSDATYKIVDHLPSHYQPYLNNEFGIIRLEDGRFAVLQPSKKGYKSSWFGGVGDGEKDDTKSLNLLFSFDNSRPAFIEEGRYKITSSLVIPSGKKVSGAGISQTNIYLATLGIPAFDLLNVERGEVEKLSIILDIENKSFETLPKKPFRGNRAMTGIAGIWANGSYNQFHDLKIVNFQSGIRLSPFSEKMGLKESYGNVLSNLELLDNDFGIIGSGQSNLKISNIKGNYTKTAGNEAPPHLIYISGVNRGVENNNVQIENIIGLPSEPKGSVIKLNVTKNGYIKKVEADSCNNLLTIGDVQDFKVEDLRLIRGFNQGLKIGNGKDKNIEVKNVFIQFDQCDRGIVFNGKQFFIENVKVDIKKQVTNKRIFRIKTEDSVYNGLDYKVKGELKKGTAYQILGSKNSFKRLKMNGSSNEIIDKGNRNTIKN